MWKISKKIGQRSNVMYLEVMLLVTAMTSWIIWLIAKLTDPIKRRYRFLVTDAKYPSIWAKSLSSFAILTYFVKCSTASCVIPCDYTRAVTICIECIECSSPWFRSGGQPILRRQSRDSCGNNRAQAKGGCSPTADKRQVPFLTALLGTALPASSQTTGQKTVQVTCCGCASWLWIACMRAKYAWLWFALHISPLTLYSQVSTPYLQPPTHHQT